MPAATSTTLQQPSLQASASLLPQGETDMSLIPPPGTLMLLMCGALLAGLELPRLRENLLSFSFWPSPSPGLCKEEGEGEWW